ncbi:MAG: glycosyltransferase family 2 protein, partial [Candidatus Hydrogenedentota bacterium]
MTRAWKQETPRVSVVIPVFNEKDNLEALWEELLPVLEGLDEPFEVVFVDDGSSDGSAAILRDLHERDERVRVIRFARNFGQQMAVTAGFHHARGEAIVLMDADLQTPPQQIPEFVAKLRAGYDVVYGKRERRVGRWYRRMGTVLANRFICSVTGFNIPDSASGFLGLNGRFVRQINRYN